tara:strand:- start:71 stop:730 length:660 start_codon:yes stop_codon:yes gene_type:complete
MANNFFNAIQTNVSNDSTLPTAVYTTPVSKKSILIELDVANKSSSGVTVTVQICDASANTGPSGNTRNVNAVATNTTGTLTTVSAHGLSVNDRVTFTNGTDPSFTDASLPSSGDTTLSETRLYYVQSVASTTTFTIAESESATSALTFDTNGASVTFTKIYLADIVRDAPVPVGGSLKVISGQKLVLEAGSSPEQDKVYVYSSAANAVDAVGSVLQEVS